MSLDAALFHGAISVPPLARRDDTARSIDHAQNDRIFRHIASGGITRFMYGGNAFLYHASLADFEKLAEWLAQYANEYLVIPSIGPTFGRALEAAAILRRHPFRCAMLLPCADPRDAAGLESGIRQLASAAGMPLVLYLKDETNFGADKDKGLDAVARLIESGDAVLVKYAVIRKDPNEDPYLDSLLRRVDRSRVISGIGERPAIVHMRDWRLPGFTSGSVSVAPGLSRQMWEALSAGDIERAEMLRRHFIPLEDLRDAWGPSVVLHHAVQLAGIAETGPVMPFLSALSPDRLEQLRPVARDLLERNSE
jgi:dihydrodipicolinate synthase/N-acetylneuraminate lyase